MHRKSLLYSGLALLFAGPVLGVLFFGLDQGLPASLRGYDWSLSIGDADIALAIFFVMAGTGLFLICKSIPSLQEPEFSYSSAPRILPELPLRNAIPWRRHSVPPLMTASPHFAFALFGVEFTLWIIFSVLPVTAFVGFPVRLSALSAVSSYGPASETLGIYIDSDRTFLLNGRPVPREKLQEELQCELDKRSVWVVYFEADNDSLYMDAIYAMDTIRSTGARIIWITPQMRSRLNQAKPKQSRSSHQ